jgi:hypothetical protein
MVIKGRHVEFGRFSNGRYSLAIGLALLRRDRIGSTRYRIAVKVERCKSFRSLSLLSLLLPDVDTPSCYTGEQGKRQGDLEPSGHRNG